VGLSSPWGWCSAPPRRHAAAHDRFPRTVAGLSYARTHAHTLTLSRTHSLLPLEPAVLNAGAVRVARRGRRGAARRVASGSRARVGRAQSQRGGQAVGVALPSPPLAVASVSAVCVRRLARITTRCRVLSGEGESEKATARDRMESLLQSRTTQACNACGTIEERGLSDEIHPAKLLCARSRLAEATWPIPVQIGRSASQQDTTRHYFQAAPNAAATKSLWCGTTSAPELKSGV
jgi:hypothetical protein